MSIDEAQKMQERKEPLKKLTNSSGSEDDAQYDDLKQQLALLHSNAVNHQVNPECRRSHSCGFVDTEGYRTL